jgi:general secretion pathway protein M
MKVMILRRLAVFEPYMLRGRTWWVGLSRREQILLGVLGGLAALWLLSVLVVAPLQSARAKAIADIRTYETLNARIRQAGSLSAAGSTRRTGPAISIIPASAGEFGLAFASVAPDGSNVRLNAGQVPYDSLMRWLAEMERSSNIRVVHLKLQRSPTPGMVAVDLLLSQ